MKCDSQASLLAHTFASPCLGHKPKVKVATCSKEKNNSQQKNETKVMFTKVEELFTN
jgi:hypothetical protein